MKNFCLMLALLIVTNVWAQPPDGLPHRRMEQNEKIKVKRIAFLTDRLDLTSEEAQVFWPVFNEHQKKKEELHRKRKGMLKGKDMSQLSDAEVLKIVDEEMNMRSGMGALDLEYHEKYKKVLPIKKVAALYRSEEKFRRDLLDRIRKRGRQGDGPMQGGKRRRERTKF